MWFRILGDISFTPDGGDIGAVISPAQRALLAVLILSANRIVTPSALIDAVWGDDDAPRHPDSALQVHMSRLRGTLGDAAERIRSEGGGYRLDVGPEEVDLTRVEMLLRDGRAALGLNDARRAADLFDAALALWTGKALEDLANFPFHAAAARRIRELHFTVYQARNDAYLIDSRHLEVLADIHEWVQADPLREHVRAQQIAALYRSGRQADALRECEELRRTLREELGIDPSAGIQELERKVLDQDPSLLAADAGLTVPMPAWTSETLSFVGRNPECEFAMEALRRASADGFRFMIVEGEAGRGKSRFLLELARRVGRDAILLPVDVHQSLRPSVVALMQTLAVISRRMKPEELRLTLGEVPEFASVFTHGAPVEEQLLAQAAQWVAVLSAKAPVVLFIDDLDRASPTLLHVIGRISAIDQPKRVLVVASARSPIATRAPLVDRLIGALDRRGVVDRVILHALTESDIDELLNRMRIPTYPRRVIAKQLFELTAGDPFLLAELLSAGPPERVVETWTVPPRVRDVVLARSDELGSAASEVLKAAAVFEREFTIPLLSEIVGISESAMGTIVDRALDARILQPSGLNTYRFAHQLARQVLAEELTTVERGEAHRRAAIALERAGASAAGLALHWSKADGPDASPKTVEHARSAGDDAKRMLEPNIAVGWYELALSHVGSDSERGALLVDLAEAQQQAGNPEYVDTLREAAQIAQDTNDDCLIVRIVTSASPGWSTLPGFTTAETLPLLERALEVVRDDATRSRVLARLATEQSLGDPAHAEVLALEAIALARASGDCVALLESLIRHTSMSHAPSSVARRREEIDEALPLAVATRDVVARYFLTSTGAVAAMQAADPDAARAHITIADAIANENDLPPLRWSQMTRGVWQAGLAGRIDDAEQLLCAARDYGSANGIAQAEHVALLQLAMLRWHQGRASTLVPSAQDEASNFGQYPGFRHVLARALADSEATRPAARRIISDLTQHQFTELLEGAFWSTILVGTAESAFLLDLPDVGRMVRRLLEPYLDQVAFSGLWVAAPIAHGAAVAAAASHDPDAGALFEHAIAIAERLDAPVLRARTQLAWVAATCKHDAARAPHAINLCEEAGTTARTLQLADIARDAEELRATLLR